MATFMARQGDVLVRKLTPGERQRARFQRVERENGAVVLAHGEATGHSHKIVEQTVEMYHDPKEGRLFVNIESPAHIVHEEHDTIKLEAGWYEVVRQREFTAEPTGGFDPDSAEARRSYAYVRD